MQKKYLRYLESKSKNFYKNNNIFDIILYGSSTKGEEEPRDIDILLIFEKKSLRERAELGQKLKEKLKNNKIKNIDIKTINLKEIFQKEFLARQGILSEGYSLINKENLSERIGFKGKMLFSYNLKNLNHNEKTKFTYALSGRNSRGMLKKLKGKFVGRGAVLIPIENSIKFKKFLDEWNINYKQKILLVSKR